MAKFNEALKAKREELGLSVADISERTRLTERYIHALEERDIQAFADDLSYLRYFVRSYCDVVGLPYDEVKEDVKQAVAQYMEEKDQELTQSHTDIERHIVDAESLSEVDKTKKSKKAKKTRKRRYNRMDASFLSFVAIVLVVLIVVVFALVVFLRGSDDAADEPSVPDTPPVQDQQDVGNSDEEDQSTQQPQKEEKAEMEIEKTGDTSYTVRNVYAGDTLRFTLQPGGSSTVDLRVDGASVNPAQQVYSFTDPFEYELNVEKSCEVSVIYGFMYNNTIQINGKALEIDSALAASQGPATFTITIEMVEE